VYDISRTLNVSRVQGSGQGSWALELPQAARGATVADVGRATRAPKPPFVCPVASEYWAGMHWERILGRGRAEAMSEAILRVLQEAYDENCRRHAPEDLGDNNITFGVAVSQNLRFLLERELAHLPGVEIVRPRGSFAVRIDGRYELYFYKAPPGVCDVQSLRFDASNTQLALTHANADQLAFRFEPAGFPLDSEELRHIVCIHFGDPLEGLHRADVGAPVESPTEGLRWEWVECLSDDGVIIDVTDATESGEVEPQEDDDIDVRLREDFEHDDRQMNDEQTG
jgi:hypothetical protein